MPTYDYVCQDCSHAFEHFQSMSSDPLSTCPECQGRLKRLIGTGGALIFKGSGFYQTDYRSESYKQKAAADKPAESKSSDTSSSSKSDAPKPSANGTGT